MFTWICPQCGREVPPSYSECPNCARKQEASAAPPPPAAPAPPQQASARPGVAAGLPAWFLSVLFAAGFIIIGLAGYWALRTLQARPQPQAAARQKLALETPAAAPSSSAGSNPIARHLEITGLRLTEDTRQRASIQFLVVNHSGADLGDFAAAVDLVAVTTDRQREPVGKFSFKTSLGPYESREMKAPVETRLRVYELPDWQFLRAEFRITSPVP